jgi:hypothetical protein
MHVCALSRSDRDLILDRMEDTMNRITRSALIPLALAIPAALGACVDDTGETSVDLAGRWRSACIDPGTGQALRLRLDVTAATWSLDYESFGDAACTSPALVVHIEGPYDVTGTRRGSGSRARR